MWKGKKQRVSRQHAAEGEFWRKAENPLLNICQFAWKVVVISLLLWSSPPPLHSLQRCSPPVVKFNQRRKIIPGEQENIFQTKVLPLITASDKYKKKKKSPKEWYCHLLHKDFAPVSELCKVQCNAWYIQDSCQEQSINISSKCT